MSVPSLVLAINRKSLECIQCWTEQTSFTWAPQKLTAGQGTLTSSNCGANSHIRCPPAWLELSRQEIYFYVLQRKKKSIKIYTHTHIQKQDAPKPGLNLLSEGRDLNPNYGQVFPSRLSTDFVSYFLLVVSAVGTFHCN